MRNMDDEQMPGFDQFLEGVEIWRGYEWSGRKVYAIRPFSSEVNRARLQQYSIGLHP